MKRIWTIVLAKLAYEQQLIQAELERLINTNEETEGLTDKINDQLEKYAILKNKISIWRELIPTPEQKTQSNDVIINNQ